MPVLQGIHYEIEREFGFELIKADRIPCQIVTCKNYESCQAVGSSVSAAGILPKAKSILDVLGLEFQLPGHGVSYSDCGDWRARGCLNIEKHVQTQLGAEDVAMLDTAGKIYVEWYHRCCYRAECPICYEKWAALEASKIEYKLRHYWKWGKVCHFTVSPSERDVLNLPYEKLKAKMYRVAKSRGIIGGSMIWHPWRENEDGTWRYSPHFHILGFGWVRDVKEGYFRDGWLVKNIKDGKDERSVFRTAMYQLSHCGLEVHGKSRPVAWFGVCSSASKEKIVIPPREKEKHVCPCCDQELVELYYGGLDRELPFSLAKDSKIDDHPWWLDPGGWVEKAMKYGES